MNYVDIGAASSICPWLYAGENIFRLCLQNLFSGVDPQTFARVEAMVSMAVRCSKGGGYGFNVGALF
jgi:hypothetical protein